MCIRDSPSRIRDSDGDGVADSVDAFPNNPGMDSWLGIIVSLVIISGIAAVGLFLFNKSRKPESLIGLNSEPDAPLEAPSLPDWD